ncbi:MAG TPA: KTSC domain-containing protein [Sphingomicrobium sp.]|nr:KTSC domain-containing protein [Sphingomicrobium sp.]
MPSTVIRRFDYSPETRELMVEFVTGRRYVYSEVPEDAAQALRSAFAKGVHFNRHIRGRFAWREIERSQAD